MKTKQDLLESMRALGACERATEFVTGHTAESALKIGLSCADLRWLIWYLGRVDATAIAGFAERCAARANGYAAGADPAYAATAEWAAAAERAAFRATHAAAFAATSASWAAEAAAYATEAAFSASASARAADTAASATYKAEHKAQLADLHDLWRRHFADASGSEAV